MSDHHFGQTAIWRDFKQDGIPMRPFLSNDEMHHTLITNHNATVRPSDKVIFVGDLSFSGAVHDEIMPQLNGRKYLVRGNHDRFSESRYTKHFAKVHGAYTIDGFLVTHFPIHPESMGRYVMNIHGHLHTRAVMKEVLADNCGKQYTIEVEDESYYSVCVERHNYTPVDFDLIKDIAEVRGQYERAKKKVYYDD